MYLHKAGTLILLASIILFFISTFPEKKDLLLDYDAAITAVQKSAVPEDVKETEISALHADRQSELLQYSIAGRVGKGLEVVLSPLGFDWKVSSALIGAFAAKELFVAQLGILYSVEDAESGETTLQQALRNSYTPLQGFCIMLFCLLTVPCIATMAVVCREANSWKFMLAQIALFTAVAYLVTLIIFQTGSALRLGTAPYVPEKELSGRTVVSGGEAR